MKWIVLIGQISYDYRNPMFPYGVDRIIACLLFILCLAPIGRAMSLDRVRAVRAAKRKNLEATLPPYASPWAGACTRLMQIQMAVLFFYSGIRKIEAKTGGAATPSGSFSRPTSITALMLACSHGNIGWSMSRPMARSSSRSPFRS